MNTEVPQLQSRPVYSPFLIIYSVIIIAIANPNSSSSVYLLEKSVRDIRLILVGVGKTDCVLCVDSSHSVLY